MKKIAVVIPFYKGEQIVELLKSLDQQTNSRFNTYIFNDNSPYPVENIIKDYSSTLNITYHKFKENLGASSLTKQWDRCIRRTEEDYFILPGDDDYFESTCIESALRIIEKYQENNELILHFDSCLIDKNSKIIRFNPPNPDCESRESFLYHRIVGHRYSYIGDFVISRSLYEKYGGFFEMPAAWGSDIISIYRFANQKPIIKANGLFYWRYSGDNVSSRKDNDIEKFNAIFIKYRWLQEETKNCNDKYLKLLNTKLRGWLLKNIKSFTPFTIFSSMNILLRYDFNYRNLIYITTYSFSKQLRKFVVSLLKKFSLF
jgi:Glycosyl transferase family 2